MRVYLAASARTPADWLAEHYASLSTAGRRNNPSDHPADQAMPALSPSQRPVGPSRPLSHGITPREAISPGSLSYDAVPAQSVETSGSIEVDMETARRAAFEVAQRKGKAMAMLKTGTPIDSSLQLSSPSARLNAPGGASPDANEDAPLIGPQLPKPRFFDPQTEASPENVLDTGIMTPKKRKPSSSTTPSAAHSLGFSIFNVSGSAPWLYRPPAPYCPIPVHLDDHIATLHRRINYLGPVNRNKVVRALEMATSHDVPLLVSQNVNVATIVADLQMDVETVCAAILRDLLHDEAEIVHEVGTDVAKILKLHADVTRVVNMTREANLSDSDCSSLRELILVSAVDPRAISLELASAVVATRSLDSLPAHVDKEACAHRAMYLYAPLANQLGIWCIQSELEELAFMHLHPEEFHEIRSELFHRVRESQRLLDDKKATLERALSTSPAVRNAVRSVQIKGRIKGTYSVYRKLQRTGKDMSDLYDLIAVRIIVQARGPDDDSQAAACYAVADAVGEHFEVVPSRSKDYVALPKSNGYRSLHLTVAPPEEGQIPLEIQIRTERMHYVAEFGAAAHWLYKEESGKIERARTTDPANPPGGNSPSSSQASDDEVGPPSSAGENGTSGPSRSFTAERMHPLTGEAPTSLPGNLDIGMSDSFDKKPTSDVHSSWTDVPPETEVRISVERPSQVLSSVRSAHRHPRLREHELCNQRRGGYMHSMVSTIMATRVIVLSYGRLYRLSVGATLNDLARAMGMASLGMIALVNGIPVPLTHRLKMSDNVRWI